MLRTKDYYAQIEQLHEEGKNAKEISRILNFKYHQPVYNYFKKRGWKNLNKKAYPRHTLYSVDSDFFKDIDTEEKAYVLGFICADGSIDFKNYFISIYLQDSDYELLEKIKECMHSTHPIKRNIKKENPYKKSNNKQLKCCGIRINGRRLVTPLKKMGLTHDKTYTLDDKVMNYIPKDLIRHFLRGYFDGDGSITWGAQYSSGKKYLIQVAGNKEFLLASFNTFFPSINGLYKYKTSKQCYAWKLSSKLNVLEFLNYIYKDAKIYLDRKYKIYQYAMWSYKTELIAGNSYFINLIKGQSAANLLVKCWEQVQRLADETICNPYEEGNIEYKSATNARQLNSSE